MNAIRVHAEITYDDGTRRYITLEPEPDSRIKFEVDTEPVETEGEGGWSTFTASPYSTIRLEAHGKRLPSEVEVP